jgi:rod shape-determining protein MreD
MTARLFGFITILLLAALQLTLLPAHLEHPFRPNLALVMVVWLSLKGRPVAGPLAAALLGLFVDSHNGLYPGLSSFAFLLICFYLSGLADRLYTDSPYLLVMVVFFSSLAYGLISALLLLLFTSNHGFLALLGTTLLPQALVNALCASIVANLGLAVRREGGT